MKESSFIKNQRRKRNNRISEMRRIMRQGRNRTRMDVTDPKYGQERPAESRNNRKRTHKRPNGKIVKPRLADNLT